MIEKSVTCLNPDGFHKLVYSEYEGDPAHTVLCIHGLSRNGQDFDFLARHLADRGHRVICPDMPGRGRSPAFSNPVFYTYAQYMADLTVLLARLEVKQVDWVGTSMGGLLGMMFAAQKDHPIRRMVVNDVGPFIDAEALQAIYNAVKNNPPFSNLDEYTKAFREYMGNVGIETEEQWQHAARISARQNPDGTYSRNYDPNIVYGLTMAGEIRDIDLWPLWEKLDVPILILRGGASPILSEEDLNRMIKDKDAKAVTFPGIEHAPALRSLNQIEPILPFLSN